MKLHHLRDLLAVADHGSVRAAAREIGIAQPAMTRSIQELERELGVALFERRSRGIVPTAIGEAFIRRARSVDNELLRARDEVAQLRGLSHGSVRVALLHGPAHGVAAFGAAPFPAALPRGAAGHHRCRLPDGGDRVAGWRDRLLHRPRTRSTLPDGMLMEKLFDNTRVIVGRKGHPLGRAKSLGELVDAEWLTTSITAQAEHELGPLFAQHGLARQRW